MSEIRERAKRAAKEMKHVGWDRWADVITDLLAELELVEKSLKVVQGHAKTAMDKLPSKWNEGFQAGLKQSASYVDELREERRVERQGRKDDNAAFTAEILRLEAELERLRGIEKQAHGEGIIAGKRIAGLEAENERLKAWKTGLEIGQEEDQAGIRRQVAQECADLLCKYSLPIPNAEWLQGRLCAAEDIKDHFRLGE